MTPTAKRGVIFLCVVLVGCLITIAVAIHFEPSNQRANKTTSQQVASPTPAPTETDAEGAVGNSYAPEVNLGKSEPLTEAQFSEKLVQMAASNPESPILKIVYVEVSTSNKVEVVYRRSARVVERICSLGTVERWTEVTDEKLLAVSNGASIKALTGYTMDASKDAYAAFARQTQQTHAAYQSRSFSTASQASSQPESRFNSYYPTEEREFWKRAEAKDPLLRQSRTKYQESVEKGRSDAEIRHRQRIADRDRERMEKQLERERKKER